MSWEPLKPLAVSPNGRAMVSVLVRKKKSGEVTLRFSFSSFVQKDLGDPKCVDVQIGSGQEAGQVQFIFGQVKGDFACKAFGKGGFSVLLPAISGAPDRDHGSEACKIVSQVNGKGGGEIILALPLAAWSPQPSPPAVPVKPPPPASTTPCPARPLDAVEYLANPWRPMSSPKDLKVIGKLGEELNEAGAAVSRCIIQGIDEAEPVTGKPNRQWLEEEIADVVANLHLTVTHFGLDREAIKARCQDKQRRLQAWHDELDEGVH